MPQYMVSSQSYEPPRGAQIILIGKQLQQDSETHRTAHTPILYPSTTKPKANYDGRLCRPADTLKKQPIDGFKADPSAGSRRMTTKQGRVRKDDSKQTDGKSATCDQHHRASSTTQTPDARCHLRQIYTSPQLQSPGDRAKS